MGKASSAKKVARAARAGGRTSAREPRSLLFPASLVIVVLLGVSLVVYARAERRAEDLAAFPQLGDPIHPAVRKSVGEGKSVAVRLDLGGTRIIKKKTTTTSP